MCKYFSFVALIVEPKNRHLMLDFLFLDVGQVYPNLIRFNLGWQSSRAIQMGQFKPS